MSRALGDFAFKTNPDKAPEDQIISCCPEIQVRDIESNWQFVLLACDGIWDVLTNQARKNVLDKKDKKMGNVIHCCKQYSGDPSTIIKW